MNAPTPVPPSPAPRRRLSSARLLMVFAVVCFALGLIAGFLKASGVGSNALILYPFALILGVIVTWTTVVYWRRLDEAAREAHKFAWYWGGSTGLLFCGATVIILSTAGGEPFLWPGMAATPMNYLYTGVMATVFAQIIGYAIVWAGWWLWNSRD